MNVIANQYYYYYYFATFFGGRQFRVEKNRKSGFEL